MNRRTFLKTTSAGALATSTFFSFAACSTTPKTQPNILWLSCEDISPHLGCYGDPNAKTPVLDNLAAQGILYENAFTVAGVCAPNRSSIITGMYASTLGSQNMRSGGEGTKHSNKPSLDPQIKCFPEYLRESGYYCTNNSKEDYNFITDHTIWDESSRKAHWKNRPQGKPFFAVFNYTGTHEGHIRVNDEQRAEVTKRLTSDQRQDRQKVKLPPYYPDTPVTREYWARYYELITALDYWIADHLRALEKAGLAEDTIVFFWSDHGVGLPRAKRWLYDSGTHIPLIIRIPGKFRQGGQGKPGTRDQQLVSSVDFAPTVLNLTGQPVPQRMPGRPFLGAQLKPERQYVYGIRDRMDERYDTIRSVRDKNFLYLRNYRCFKPYYQYMQSAERGPIMQEIRRLQKEGKLPPAAALFTADHKPPEELYDVKKDPDNIHNLAGKPEYKQTLDKMRRVHLQWMLKTRDLGLFPEPELTRLEKELGSRYAILRRPGSEEFLKKLQKLTITAGTPKKSDLESLQAALNDQAPTIRYWSATGLGNLGKQALSAWGELKSHLKDDSPVVRVAAAEALCKMGKIGTALPVLKAELQSPHEWVRLNAAIVLDELGEAARPAIPELQHALKDQENKYVVRVVNHALNKLLGTNNRVR